MKRTLLFLVMIILLAAVSASAQSGEAPAQKAAPQGMKVLSWLVGHWRGTGWIQMGPRRTTFTVDETAESRLDGQVLLLEGVGHDTNDPTRVVHQAFAVVSYNGDTGRYQMRAFRAGHSIDPNATVEDGAFVWSFSPPGMGADIRYTLRKNGMGQWHEVGETSRDGGTTWSKFFEMTLDRE